MPHSAVYWLYSVGLEGSMGTAMTRRRSGPLPDSADYAMSDIFADLSRKQGSGREMHHFSDIQFVYPVALALFKKRSVVFRQSPVCPSLVCNTT